MLLLSRYNVVKPVACRTAERGEIDNFFGFLFKRVTLCFLCYRIRADGTGVTAEHRQQPRLPQHDSPEYKRHDDRRQSLFAPQLDGRVTRQIIVFIALNCLRDTEGEMDRSIAVGTPDENNIRSIVRVILSIAQDEIFNVNK